MRSENNTPDGTGFVSTPALVGRTQPQGMILALTLVILLLMSLMGTAILMNTRTELNISGNTSLGRDAFARTDSAARIAALLTNIMLSPEFQDPREVLTNTGDYTVEILDGLDANGGFNLGDLQFEASGQGKYDYDVRLRYIRAGSAETRAETPGALGDSYRPHMVFKVKTPKPGGGTEQRVMAASAVALDYGDPTGYGATNAGTSLGSNGYDNGGAVTIRLVLIVSTNGRPPYQASGAKSSEAFDGGWLDEPHSVVTILLRKVII